MAKDMGLHTGGEAEAPHPLIRLSGISKQFVSSDNIIEILKDLSLEIARGETIAVVGESGIGKSTFLHILGALDYPDSGELLYKEKNVFKMDNAQLAEFRNATIGFVFQFHYLLSGFTAIENVMMPGLVSGMKRKAVMEDAEAILLRVGLKDRLKHRVSEMSGGEQQRVALARALVLKPDLLLADEPTGNLDKKNSEQVHEFLVELNREMGMAMVVVTHNLNLAGLMGRKMTIMDGKLQCIESD